MKFEGNLARKSMPVFDDREADISKEKGKLNLQSLALEKLGRKDISGEERNESYKILFEQNPDLAMELAKKEEVFPLTALTKSGFFYFQSDASSNLDSEIRGLINSDKIKTSEFKIYAPEILEWAKKDLAFSVLKGAGGVGRSLTERSDFRRLVEIAGQRDEEMEMLIGKEKPLQQGKEKYERREDRVEMAERIFRREMEKVQDLPEGKNIFYQNAKAVFSTEGEAGLQKFLEKHQDRIEEMPPHLMLDLHYMRYAGFREFKLPESGDSRKKTPREIGIDAINMVKDALEKGEENYQVKAHGKTRMHRLAKALAGMLNAPGTLTEGFAFSELKRDFEKSLRERYGAKVEWDEKTDGIQPKIILGEKKEKKILRDKEIKIPKGWMVPRTENINDEIVYILDNNRGSVLITENGPIKDDGRLFYAIFLNQFEKIRNNIFAVARTNEYIEYYNNSKSRLDSAFRETIIGKNGPIIQDKNIARVYLKDFKDRIIFKAVKIDGKNVVMESDGKTSHQLGHEEFKDISLITDTGSGIVYVAERFDGSQAIVTEKGIVKWEVAKPRNRYDKIFITDLVDIKGKIFFELSEGFEESHNRTVIKKTTPMSEDGPIGNEVLGTIGEFKNINDKLVFTSKTKNAHWTIMTENGPIGDEFDKIYEIFCQNEQAYVIGKNGNEIIRKHIPELSEELKNPKEKLEDMKVDISNYETRFASEEARNIYDKLVITIKTKDGKDAIIIDGILVDMEMYNGRYEVQEINGKIVFQSRKKNGCVVMMGNKQISNEFDGIDKIFSQDDQAYVLGKIEDKIVRRHIPELSIQEDQETKIELNFQEKEILEMLNILKIGQNRPRWKKEMSEEEKERYGEFYDHFRELSKKFFQEDSRKIPFNSLLQEAVAGFSEKNKLYAQKNSADPNELLNDFKDAWLKRFIKPEQRRDFERGISDFRKNFEDNSDFFNTSDDPEMAFLDSFESGMMGGDPKMEGAEILENLNGYNGFLVKNNFSGGKDGKFSQSNLDFLPEKRFRETEKFAFKVNPVPRKINQLNLPMPAESRLKGISAQNESGEVKLENLGSRENIAINLESNFQEITYEIERNKLKCPIDAEMKWHELQKVYARLPENVTADFSEHLFSLPVEMKEEMEKIKNLPIIEQVATLQKMAQDNFHYDMDYGNWRKSAGKELKRRMNKSQLQAIKHKKLFAGVCAEANLVMCQVLRQAGILSGIAEGFMTDGKNIKNTEAHACTFALLPNERGEMEKYYIDGTPGGAVEGHLPSILEMQKIWEKSQEVDEKKISEETSKDLEKMVEYLEGELKLLNGDIEALLNGELKRVIAGGAEKLVDISQSLGIVRFSGLNLENLTKMEADVKGFFEKEMRNPRMRSLAKKEIEKNGKQAGEYVLEELKKTVDFLEKRFGLDKAQSREWFKNFNKNNMAEILSIEERALLNLAVDYIK